MAKPGGTAPSNKRVKLTKKAAAKQRKRQEQDSDAEDVERNQGEMSKKEAANHRAKMRLHAQSVAKSHTVSDAMIAQVKKVTSKELWKHCKFFKNEDFLRKGTNFVMQKLELAELEGLSQKERIKREEIWKEVHAPYVREALNKHRNYVSGEIQKVVWNALTTDQEATLPNPQEIKLLMTRDQLDESTDDTVREDMERKFVTYVNVLLPKVAGNKWWGPAVRHYYLPSFHKHDVFVPEGSGLECSVDAVSASDEAFLVVVFENSHAKWKAQADKYKKSVLDNQADHEVEIFVPKNDKTDYQLPCTNAKAGNLKFGGWKENGIKAFDRYKDKVEKSREDNPDFNKSVEEDCLVQIQKAEGILEGDDKAPKGKKKKGKSHNVFAEEDAGAEDDFDLW